MDAESGVCAHPQTTKLAAANGAPSQGTCTFYLAQKKRRCRQTAAADQIYCGNHLFLVTKDGDRRVPCEPSVPPCNFRPCFAVKLLTAKNATRQNLADLRMPDV